MPLDLLERLSSRHDDLSNTLHQCGDCRRKERVHLTSPDGRQTAMVWRCRTLSQKTSTEVLVQPHENCYEHRSLTDYWEPADREFVR